MINEYGFHLTYDQDYGEWFCEDCRFPVAHNESSSLHYCENRQVTSIEQVQVGDYIYEQYTHQEGLVNRIEGNWVYFSDKLLAGKEARLEVGIDKATLMPSRKSRNRKAASKL